MASRPRPRVTLTADDTRVPAQNGIMADLLGMGGGEEPAAPPQPEVEVEVQTVVVHPLPSLESLPTVTVPASEDNTLTEDEIEALKTYEDKIGTALNVARQAFWVLGTCFRGIRDGRLYRAKHATFEEYCAEVWDMSYRQMNRLIRAHSVALALTAAHPELLTADGSINLTESQARELAPPLDEFGEESVLAIWAEATKDEKKVTAASLASVRDELGYGQVVREARPALPGRSRPELSTPSGQEDILRARSKTLADALKRKVTRAEVVRATLDMVMRDDDLFQRLTKHLGANA